VTDGRVPAALDSALGVGLALLILFKEGDLCGVCCEFLREGVLSVLVEGVDGSFGVDGSCTGAGLTATGDTGAPPRLLDG